MTDAPATRATPSPNHEPRPAGRAVDTLILHYTGMATSAAALDRLRDPAAKVSAHYLIATEGTVYALVPEARRAWHAGVAAWGGASDINDRSVGIELVNPGHDLGYHPFPAPQMAALIALGRTIRARHPIPSHRVLGHSDVAPQRKMDPGEFLDWERLAAHGLGVVPLSVPAPRPTPDVAWFQAALAAVGYAVPQSGTCDSETRNVLAAFQRHYRRDGVTGARDGQTAARLLGLRRQLEARGAFA